MAKKGKATTEAAKGQMIILDPEAPANQSKGGAKKQARWGSVKSRQQKLGDLEKFSEAIEQVSEKLAKEFLEAKVVNPKEIIIRSK